MNDTTLDSVFLQSNASERRRLLDTRDSMGDNQVMAKRKTPKLTEQIRQAMTDSGFTRYRIAKETGISEATLSKFHLGQRGLSMEALNALGEFLQLKVTLGVKPAKKGE